MQVRMKIGPKAGQIVDVVYHAARTLVEAGQAEDVHDQMRLEKPQITRIDDVIIEGRRIPTEVIAAVAESHTSKKKRK